MKFNKDLLDSARKMRKMGLEREEVNEILDRTYSLTGRLLGRRTRLERELGKFIAYNNGKTFYQDRPEDKDTCSREYSREVSSDFTKRVLYRIIFGQNFFPKNLLNHHYHL